MRVNLRFTKNYLGLFFLDIIPSSNTFFDQAITKYKFNMTGRLSGLFTGSVTIANASKGTAEGIGKTLSISVSGSTEGILATNESYSSGQVGSTYIFESFIKSEENSVYSGVELTACSTGTVSNAFAYEPNDALRVTHIDVFAFHNGATNNTWNWEINYTSGSISNVKTPTIKNRLKRKVAPNYSISSLLALTSLVTLEVIRLLRMPFSSCVNQYSLTI